MNEIWISDSRIVFNSPDDADAEATFNRYKWKVDNGIVNDNLIWKKNGQIHKFHSPQADFLSKLVIKNKQTPNE